MRAELAAVFERADVLMESSVNHSSTASVRIGHWRDRLGIVIIETRVFARLPTQPFQLVEFENFVYPISTYLIRHAQRDTLVEEFFERFM